MALDDDQRNWNKENVPLDDEKAACWQVSQNAFQEIRQDVTREALAELTIKNFYESDESDEREDNGRQQCSHIRQSSLLFQQSDYFRDFQNNETSNNGASKKQTRIVSLHECSAHNTSSEGDESQKCFCSGDECTFSENISTQSVEPKSLQPCRRIKCSIANFSENKWRKQISDHEKFCKGVEEFVTPPLSTIPGFELEYKFEGCGPEALSETITTKNPTSPGLSREMQIQNEHLLK